MIDVKALKSLYKREKFLVISNLAVMTVTFLILGFFLSLSIGFQTAIKNLEEQAQVTLFFKDEYPEAQILALREQLLQDERILSVTYVSKEEAFRIFTDINKDEPILLEAVSKDILPASLEIRTQKLVSLSEVADQFKNHEGVEEVKFFRDVVDRFRYWARMISVVGGVLVAVFVALSLSIILATLRISIGSKADEIEITKLDAAFSAIMNFKPVGEIRILCSNPEDLSLTNVVAGMSIETIMSITIIIEGKRKSMNLSSPKASLLSKIIGSATNLGSLLVRL